MRPAFSILLFTTLSGAGYGLWFLLGTMLAGGLPLDGTSRLALLAVGLALTTTGLLASVAHLGQPQRAWRALSQWRSSWLSREGVAAIACGGVAIALGGATLAGADAAIVRALGAALAALAVVTVFCTARIYSSLPTIPAWRNSYVLPAYLLFALATGALWSWAVMALCGARGALPALAAVVAAPISAALKLAYWRFVDRLRLPGTTSSATGLAGIGTVRTFEKPHTEENYLTRELGFAFARRHAVRLRALSACLVGLVPLAFVALVLLGAPRVLAAITATLAATLGAFVERWLFFAEAKHVVMRYYGADDPPRSR